MCDSLLYLLPAPSWDPLDSLSVTDPTSACPDLPLPAHRDPFLAEKILSLALLVRKRVLLEKGHTLTQGQPLPSDQLQPLGLSYLLSQMFGALHLTADGRVCHRARPMGVSHAMHMSRGMWL